MFEKECSILHVPRDADQETVRKAFVKLSRRYPPEHFPEKFKTIKNAYERLSLNYSSIKTLVQELSSHHTPKRMIPCLFEQALQIEATFPRLEVPEMDVMSLEPIFAASDHQRTLQAVLKDIQDQGVEYEVGPNGNGRAKE